MKSGKDYNNNNNNCKKPKAKVNTPYFVLINKYECSAHLAF